MKEDKAIIIKEAVIKLVGIEGLSGLTLKKVAQEAGLSAGTVYLYYKSKEEMIEKIYIELKKELSQTYMPVLNGDPFLAVFTRVFDRIFDYMTKNQYKMIFIDQCYRSPYVSQETRNLTDSYFEPLVIWLVESQNKKEVKNNFAPNLLLTFIYGVLLESSKAAEVDNTEELKSAAFSFCWEAIKP